MTDVSLRQNVALRLEVFCLHFVLIGDAATIALDYGIKYSRCVWGPPVLRCTGLAAAHSVADVDLGTFDRVDQISSDVLSDFGWQVHQTRARALRVSPGRLFGAFVLRSQVAMGPFGSLLASHDEYSLLASRGILMSWAEMLGPYVVGRLFQ